VISFPGADTVRVEAAFRAQVVAAGLPKRSVVPGCQSIRLMAGATRDDLRVRRDSALHPGRLRPPP